MSTYTIKWGDTLSGIARDNNTDVNTLMSLNPYITNANKIYAGKSLVLPDAEPTPQPVQQQPAPQPVVQQPVAQPVQQPTKTTQELAQEYATKQTANASNDTQALLNQYEKIAEAQKQALATQQQLTANQINAQRQDVMDQYNANARQAYINSMLGKKQVEQQLSQAGLNTSGLLGSAYANVENAYGNNLATLQASRDKSVNDINRQLNDAQLQYAVEEQKLLSNIENAKLELQKYGNELAYKKYQDAINNYMTFTNYDYNKSIDERDYNYQLSRDKVKDEQWQKQFDYQREQDELAQDNWLKEYQLALKKASASSSRRSSGGTSSNDNNKIREDDTPSYSYKDIISNVKQLPGVSANGPYTAVYDGLSGRTFASMEDLLNNYGYAVVK